MAFGNIIGMGLTGLWNAAKDVHSPFVFRGSGNAYASPAPAPAPQANPNIGANPNIVTSTGAVYGPTRANYNPTTTNTNRNTGQGTNNIPTGNSGGGGPSGPNQGDVDAVYNPIADFLNKMSQEYEAGRAPAEENINSSFGRQLTPINEQEQTQLGIQNKQEGVINTGEQNALAQARQLYSELSQSNLAKYGTGSSAGPATNELLGRTTAKQFGDIGQTATSGRVAVEEERGNIKKFAEQKRVDLNSQKEEAIRTLQAEFRNGMLQINQMKAQNESAKASARLDLLQRAQEQAFQIEQADKAYQRAIDQFERESAVTAQQNAAYSSKQTLGGDTVNAINQILSNPNLSKAQKVFAIQQAAPNYNGTQLFSGIPADKQDELTNPFTQGQ